MTTQTFSPSSGLVTLLPGLFKQRYDLNRRYVMDLRNEHLLQNFYQEARLWAPVTALRPNTSTAAGNSPPASLRTLLGRTGCRRRRTASAVGHDVETRQGRGDRLGTGPHAEGERRRMGRLDPPTYLDWIARGKRRYGRPTTRCTRRSWASTTCTPSPATPRRWTF
ncbi:MAG: hypothetical protein R2856_05775 [Caldilineaceae bacterium]